MDIEKIKDSIISIARKIDNLSFPLKSDEEMEKWRDILDDLNNEFVDWDIAVGLA
jgi:hypothetical protein